MCIRDRTVLSVDEALLARLLENLMNNSVRHTVAAAQVAQVGNGKEMCIRDRYYWF